MAVVFSIQHTFHKFKRKKEHFFVAKKQVVPITEPLPVYASNNITS
jgi:hypothetical protein